MDGTGSNPRRLSSRLVAAAAVVLALVVALLIAFLNSNSVGAAKVAHNAERLHWANATMGAAGIVRASQAQAVFFSVDKELGVASDQAAQAALAEASANLAAFDGIAADPVLDRSQELRSAIEDFSVAAHGVLAHVEASEPMAADEVRTTAVEPAFGQLSDLLEGLQTEMVEAIKETEALAGRIALIAQMGVTLLIPAATMLIYWLMVRQRMRDREVELNAKLEAERALGRARDTFIAGVSHELRTPLTSIYGFSEVLIESGLVDPAMSMELVNMINAEAGELSRMVEDLLTSSRLDAGALSVQIERVDLGQALDQVVLPFRRSGMAVELECGDVQVEADPLRLRQVLRNLISNAHRHGGPEIAVRVLESGGWARLVVTDNGDGIPDAVEDRLFQRFANEGQRALLAGSVGLGLAVSQALVERMGGSIRYDRVHDLTCFSFRLPTSLDTDRLAQELADEKVSA